MMRFTFTFLRSDTPLDAPALQPPAGVKPNFEDPYSLQAANVATFTICLTITTLFFGARMITKIFIIKNTGLEDYLCGGAYICLVLLTPFSAQYFENGGGSHQWDLKKRNMIDIAYWLRALIITYEVGYPMVKVAIPIQFRKIFVPMKKSDFMWWSTWAITIIVFNYYIISIFFQAFLCNPIEKAWRPNLEGHCYNRHALHLGSASINIITDFMLLLLPQRAIQRLHLSRRARFNLGLVFMVGLLACIFAVVRLYYVIVYIRSDDVSYNSAPLGLWTVAEMACGIVCLSSPTLPRLGQTIAQKLPVLRRVFGFTSGTADSGPRVRSTIKRWKGGERFGGQSKGSKDDLDPKRVAMNTFYASCKPVDSMGEVNSLINSGDFDTQETLIQDNDAEPRQRGRQ